MTQSTGPDLNKCCSVAALSRPARQVHLAVLAALAQTGRAPAGRELERLARDQGANPAAVRAELADRDVIAFGADGQIRAAYPFSPVPTPIQVTWAGGPAAYAMCAIDALGVSAMLGRPVTITAAEPGTGRIVTVHADRGQARWDPSDAVVFAGATGDDSCPSADRSCGYINFFTSTQAALDWADRHPAITGTVLDQAQALHQGAAEFGAFMEAAGSTSRS
jgi:Alkylmercury lyase